MCRHITWSAKRQSYHEEHDDLGQAITNTEQIVAEAKELQKAAADQHKAAAAELKGLKSQKKDLGRAPRHSNSARSNEPLSSIPRLVGAQAVEVEAEPEVSSQTQSFGAEQFLTSPPTSSLPPQLRTLDHTDEEFFPPNFFPQRTASDVTGIPFPSPDTGESLNISEEDLHAMLDAPGFDFDEFMARTQEVIDNYLQTLPDQSNLLWVGDSPEIVQDSAQEPKISSNDATLRSIISLSEPVPWTACPSPVGLKPVRPVRHPSRNSRQDATARGDPSVRRISKARDGRVQYHQCN
ncbi:hypothetical protein R3P38DRAFT_3219589 [Favolaschia claudopus]|uniref:Uncharacterized protein n=1 Tax=Favolaschia claudopus TaxID=2862362 RepID=A0AAW0A1S8_9AGAR